MTIGQCDNIIFCIVNNIVNGIVTYIVVCFTILLTIQNMIFSHCHIVIVVTIQYVLFNIVDNIVRVWFADALSRFY
jgi:hypothetical protein